MTESEIEPHKTHYRGGSISHNRILQLEIERPSFTDEEEKYYNDFRLHKSNKFSAEAKAGSEKAKQTKEIVDFFQMLYKSEKSKWQYIVDHFLIYPLTASPGFRQAMLDSDWTGLLFPLLKKAAPDTSKSTIESPQGTSSSSSASSSSTPGHGSGGGSGTFSLMEALGMSAEGESDHSPIGPSSSFTDTTYSSPFISTNLDETMRTPRKRSPSSVSDDGFDSKESSGSGITLLGPTSEVERYEKLCASVMGVVSQLLKQFLSINRGGEESDKSTGTFGDLLKIAINSLYYHCVGIEEGEKLSRQMLLVVIRVLDKTAKEYKHVYSHSAWKNILDFLTTVHNFIFYSPAPRTASDTMSTVTAEDVLALATAAADRAKNPSTPGKHKTMGKEKKAVKMHIGPKGCHDLPLVQQVSIFLNETLKVQQLDAVLETDKQMQQIQKQLKVRLEPEADFFKQLDEFFVAVPKFGGVNAQARKQMEPVVEAALRRPNTVPKQELEDALLGLVHVVSMALVTPNMGRRRTPSHNSTTARTHTHTRARRGTGEQHPLPRALRQSLSSLSEDGQLPADLDSSGRLERTVSEGSTESTDSNSSNSSSSSTSGSSSEDTAPKIIHGVRPRNASAGSGTVFKLEPPQRDKTTESLPTKPHHSRRGGTTLPVWTGTVEEEDPLTLPGTSSDTSPSSSSSSA